jgi:hypothetical protein
MRTLLLTYLTANLTGSIKTSQELPFDQGGNALYLKNMKRVYLGEPTKEQATLVPLLSEDDICQTITTVQGYLAMDAKNRNADLDSALATMATAKLVNTITDSFRKEFDYTTTIDNDILLYEFEYRFYNIA